MNQKVAVIGGGTAGMEAAGQLAKYGYEVTLIEKQHETGGHVKDWYHLFPDRRDSREVISYLEDLTRDNGIKFITSATVESVRKNTNSFTINITSGKEIDADAVVIATGFDLFKSERKEEYGYGIYDNVINSADLEKMFRSGSVKRHDGRVPERIGFIHCVGSRDEKVGNLFCSKLCCVTAVKQAIEIRKNILNASVFCFYMDMRMGGALYEELYREAQEEYGIVFIRGKVSEVSENIDNRLIVKAEDTLAGRPLRMDLDLLVLMAGMEMSEGGREIAANSDLQTGQNRYFLPLDHHFGSNKSKVSGIFYAGTCVAPMNITETISHARAAASDVMDYLRNMKS